MALIGFDLTRAIGEKTGIGWYTWELARGLLTVDQENEYLLYCLFKHFFPNGAVPDGLPISKNYALFDKSGITRFLYKVLFEKTDLPVDSFLGRPDLVHSTAFTSPRLRKAKLVVTIPDVTFITNAEHHIEKNIEFCTRQSALARKRAARVIAISESTKRDIVEYLDIPEERIAVTHLAADGAYKPIDDDRLLDEVRARYQLDGDFLFYVGTVEPRKNLARLIKAYSRLEPSVRDHYRLVIAGGSGWLNSDIYALVESLKLEGSVRFLGYVAAADLPVLYNLATAFAYPSLYEGFGLPPLEAMACGVPVVTSNVSSLPEVVGDAALTVDPTDVDMLSDALGSLLRDEALRASLRRKGLYRAAEFSWERAAKETLAVYRSVLSE